MLKNIDLKGYSTIDKILILLNWVGYILLQSLVDVKL